MCSHIHTSRYLYVYTLTYRYISTLRISSFSKRCNSKLCYTELVRLNRNSSLLSAVEPMHCWQSQKVSRERYHILRARVYMSCALYMRM